MVRAGLGGVMVGHLQVQALDPDRGDSFFLVAECGDRVVEG